MTPERLAQDELASAADRLARRLIDAAQDLERRFDSSFAGLGLNLSRAQVLAHLARHGSEGCSQTDLAAALRLSESNICTLIERMRTDGWIMRLRSSVDRRKSIVVLSPRGLDAIEQLLEARRRCTTETVGQLGLDRIESLNTLLDALLDSLTTKPAVESLNTLRRAS